MIQVQSRFIHSVGYDGRGTLHVRLLRGGTYVYYNVPSSLFERLLKAESKGRFIIYEVFQKPYKYTRLQ